MHLNEKTLSSQPAYDGCIFTITKDIAELEDGTTARRDVLHHPGGVGVIPVTDENEVLLVKQFRYPFSEITTEIPAGKLDYGESHSECGKRELLEETGCTCSEYTYLGEIYPVPAYDTEISKRFRRLCKSKSTIYALKHCDNKTLFLSKIRKYNPSAIILWTWGMIKLDKVPEFIKKAVDDYKKESGDENVFTLELEAMEDVEINIEDKGSRSHPGPKTHLLAAKKISTFLEKLK